MTDPNEPKNAGDGEQRPLRDLNATARGLSPDVRLLWANLAASKAELDEAYATLDQSALQRPGPDQWSAWDVAYHVAQIEIWYVAKLCEAASSGPIDALDRFMHAWDALRKQANALVRDIPKERLDEEGWLSGVPDWTPRQLVEQMAAHDREHAAQVLEARRLARG